MVEAPIREALVFPAWAGVIRKRSHETLDD